MSKSYYINGTTVRELEEARPVRREQQRSREEIEKAQRQKARRNAARRNREKAHSMSLGHVAFLTVCVIACAGAASSLIKMQASVTTRMNRVAALESQVADLKSDNDARYKEITTSVDLNHIKDVALNELGMSYATEDQIVYYTVNSNNYMDQYSDIPE